MRAAELPPRDAAFCVAGEGRAESARLARLLRERGYEAARPATDEVVAESSETGPPRTFLWRPSPWLIECMPHLPTSGWALDVATGSGRNAVWLALAGLRVGAIDVLPDALARARRLAASALPIARAGGAAPGACAFAVADATRALPFRHHRFHAITGFRYLDRELFPQLAELLVPGGFLVWETFTVEQRRFGPPHRAEFLLEPGELLRLCTGAGLEPVASREGAGPWGPALAGILARRF